MDEKKDAVNTTDPAADQDVANDTEAIIAALKARETKLIEERDNWKTAALKFKGKSKEEFTDEDEKERMMTIAKEALAETQLADIARELDAINRKTLKENKELKLALLNRKEPSAAAGTHSEATAVRDTSITPEQMTYFKSRNWSDKDIERYKRNLAKRI